MYRCDDCKNDFEAPKLIKDYESGDFCVCPNCDNSDYYEIIECPVCGKTECVDDIYMYCGMCIDCFSDKYTDEIGYRYFSGLPQKDKEDALKYIFSIDNPLIDRTYEALLKELVNEYLYSVEFPNFRSFCFSKDLKEWVFEDISDFADWCEKQGVF